MTATPSKTLKMNWPKSKTWTLLDAGSTLLDAKVILSQRFSLTKFWLLPSDISVPISRHLPSKMRGSMSALKQLWRIVLSKNFRKWRSQKFILRVNQWKTKVSKRHAVENDKILLCFDKVVQIKILFASSQRWSLLMLERAIFAYGVNAFLAPFCKWTFLECF